MGYVNRTFGAVMPRDNVSCGGFGKVVVEGFMLRLGGV